MAQNISETDRIILNRIQSEFPITPRPFQSIASDVGISEKEVLSSILRLKHDGIIRRIGGNFVPKKIGFVSTLCAAMVPEEKIDLFSDTVNRFSGVTHNYIRNNDFNVWFTFIGKSKDIIAENIKIISEETGIKPILNLPATMVFKIKAKFTL